MQKQTFIAAAVLVATTSLSHASGVRENWEPHATKSVTRSFNVADDQGGWKERAKHEREYERERAKDRREREHEEHRHREEMERAYREEDRYEGPPPWARAHGWREKQEHRFRYRHYDRDRYATAAETVGLPATGFGHCNREVVGGLLGAAAGGFLGSNVGNGNGKIAAVISGTILGALVGGSIGRSMDQVDQNCVGQVLERTPTGRTVEWHDPDNGEQYQVTPINTYRQSNGRYCREYQTTIVIGGRPQRAYGTACRNPDGSWQKQPG